MRVYRKRGARKPISTIQLANHNDLTTRKLYCRNYSCRGRTGDWKCQPTKVRRISANEPLPRVMSHPIWRSLCVTCTCAPASLATPWPSNLGATSISTTPLFRQFPKGTPNPTSQMTSTVSTNRRSPQSSKLSLRIPMRHSNTSACRNHRVESKNGGHECLVDPQTIRSRQHEPRVQRECDGSLERKGTASWSISESSTPRSDTAHWSSRREQFLRVEVICSTSSVGDECADKKGRNELINQATHGR